ncbi:MAG: ribosome small subunit-dependent GTPase A [Coriobacteriia bacterium]|nr:ribosome small subunit-dependent GTPase A [Coriobacteriia bacterium]
MTDTHLYEHDEGESKYHFDHLGCDEKTLELFASLAIPDSFLARIVRVDRGLPLASSRRGTGRVEPSNHLLKAGKRDAASRAAVGDWVALVSPASHEMPIIEAILPRHGTFTRKDPADIANEQVVIANIDVVFLVQALSGSGVNVARLERELVIAFESGATPVIVLTKVDLIENDQALDGQIALARSVSAGARVIVESAVTHVGVDEVKDLIEPGMTAAMVGASGVGKSTLANRLVGFEMQETGEVRMVDDKGRHTTVAREIVEIPNGGVLIDTPGMRSIALWRGDRGLDLAFPEVAEAAASCKFADCAHINEPGCAVRGGVVAGTIAATRVERYLTLVNELDDLARMRDEQSWNRKESRPARKRSGRG